MMWFFVIALSAALGSFANVLIHRLPLMILMQDDHVESVKSIDLVQPASHCPLCHTPIKWWQNIPLISFIILCRRCAACRTVIAWRYFIVECGVVLLAVLSVWLWGWTVMALAHFTILYFLWVLAWIDALHLLLPDILTLLLLWLGLLYHAFWVPVVLSDRVLAAALGYLLLYTVSWVYFGLTGRQGLGFGDMKLLAAIGAWLGLTAMINTLIVACMLALIYALILKIVSNKRAGHILPLGPFLAIAAATILISSFDLNAWLMGLL